MAEETDEGLETLAATPSTLERRSVEAVESLADGTFDDLAYFDDGEFGPAPANVKAVWKRATRMFGEFEEVTGTALNEDDRAVSVFVSTAEDSLVCRFSYDEYGDVAGAWIEKAGDSGFSGQLSESVRSFKYGIESAVSSVGREAKERVQRLRGEGPSEEELAEAARAVAEELAAESFETVHDRFADQLAEVLTSSQLAATWYSVVDDYEGIEAVEHADQWGTVVVRVATDGDTVDLVVTFDVDGDVAGITFSASGTHG